MVLSLVDKWNTDEFGTPFSFKGWENENGTLIAVFERQKGSEYIFANLMARAVLDLSDKEIILDVPTSVILDDGERVDLYPEQELKKARDSYIESKEKLLPNVEDFGARYMTSDWTRKPQSLTLVK